MLELDLAAQDNPWSRAVLTAISYARGDGISADLLLDAVNVFAPSGAIPRRQEITSALSAVRFYLRESADIDGTTLYRLFHQGLADYLQHGSVEKQRVDAIVESLQQSTAEGQLAAALLQPLQSVGGPTRRWSMAEPYLRRHAADHCIRGGRLDLLAEDAELLVYADPGAVTALIKSGCFPWLSATIFTELQSRIGRSPENFRFALAIQAVAAGAIKAAARLGKPPGEAPVGWEPLWATPGRSSSTNAVQAVASGHGVVVTGDASGVVAVRDAKTGRLIRSAQVHSAGVTALDVGPGDKPFLVAAGSSDGTVVVTDLRGDNRASLAFREITSVALAKLDGRVLLLVSEHRGIHCVDVDGGVVTLVERKRSSPRLGTDRTRFVMFRRLIEAAWHDTQILLSDPKADVLIDRLDFGFPIRAVVPVLDTGLLVHLPGQVVVIGPITAPAYR